MISDYLFIAICNVFLLIVIWNFFGDLFELKDSSWLKRLVFSMPWYLCTYLTSELFHSIIANIIVNIVFLYIILIPYKASRIQKIAAVCLVELINGACDYLAYIAFVLYSENDDVYAISYVGTVILALVCEILLKRFLRKNKGKADEYNEMAILVTIPIIMLAVLFCSFKSGETGIYLIMTGLSALVVSFVSFLLYNVLITNHIEKIERVVLDRQINAYKRELNRIEKTELKLEGIRHDLRHHIIEMENLTNNRDFESLERYLKSMKKDLLPDEKVSMTGKYEMDSLINCLIEEAGQELKTVDIKATIPDNLNIERYRLNVIVGNLLENAIDAAKKSEEQFLRLCISVNRNILYIDVENSFSNAINTSKDGFRSTKSNKNGHGLGLKNVKRIVEEFDGKMEITTDNRRFGVHIIMIL